MGESGILLLAGDLGEKLFGVFCHLALAASATHRHRNCRSGIWIVVAATNWTFAISSFSFHRADFVHRAGEGGEQRQHQSADNKRNNFHRFSGGPCLGPSQIVPSAFSLSSPPYKITGIPAKRLALIWEQHSPLRPNRFFRPNPIRKSQSRRLNACSQVSLGTSHENDSSDPSITRSLRLAPLLE